MPKTVARLEPVGGGTDILWGCRSSEHLDQLRLEARREGSASVAFGVGKVSPGRWPAAPARSGRRARPSGNSRPPAPDAAVAPLEEAAGLVDRVDDVGHLERLGEEMLVDEQVVVRKEDPEAGMGVIPADDVEIGKQPVALAGDLFPRVVGVGEAGLGVGVVLGLERLGDPDERLAGGLVEAFLAQQDAPQLDGRVGERVALDGVGGAAIEEDRQVAGRRDLVGQAGELAVAVGPRAAAPARGPSSRRRRSRRRSTAQSPARRARPRPVRGQEEESGTRRPVDPHDIVRRECRRGKASGPASGESSSTALIELGPAGSRQFGQTASAAATLIRGRITSLTPAAPRALDRARPARGPGPG